jgi:hypothetical protein
MKLLIKSTIAVLLLLSFQSCTKCIIEPEPNRENDLQIRFTNQSEDKIKEFSFAGQLIGNLSAGKTTRYYSFNSIAINAHKEPITESNAEYNGYNIASYLYDTDENTFLTNGKHTINVDVYQYCGVGLGVYLAD